MTKPAPQFKLNNDKTEFLSTNNGQSKSNQIVKNDGIYYYMFDTSTEILSLGKEENPPDTEFRFYADAVVGGVDKCPQKVSIPREFTINGVRRPVEAIGAYAFNECRHIKEFFITKQVRIIKYGAIAQTYGIQNFTIESGSRLEIIEESGLRGIGPSEKSMPLILPATVRSVAPEGLFNNLLFKKIIYCGSVYLHNKSIYAGMASEVMVTSKYSYDEAMGKRAIKDSSGWTEGVCKSMEPKPTAAPTKKATSSRSNWPTRSASNARSLSASASASPSSSSSSSSSSSASASASPSDVISLSTLEGFSQSLPTFLITSLVIQELDESDEYESSL